MTQAICPCVIRCPGLLPENGNQRRRDAARRRGSVVVPGGRAAVDQTETGPKSGHFWKFDAEVLSDKGVGEAEVDKAGKF